MLVITEAVEPVVGIDALERMLELLDLTSDAIYKFRKYLYSIPYEVHPDDRNAATMALRALVESAPKVSEFLESTYDLPINLNLPKKGR